MNQTSESARDAGSYGLVVRRQVKGGAGVESDSSNNRSLRILLSAYCCNPAMGSEYGRGWAWVKSLHARGHILTVLTSELNRSAIELHLANNPGVYKNVQFVYVHTRRLPEIYHRMLPSRSKCLVREFFEGQWQRAAYRSARRKLNPQDYDLVHHVTNTSIRRPSYLWRLGLPTVLGPLAGGHSAPLRLRRSFPVSGHLCELARDVANLTVKLRPAVKRNLERASLVFVDSDATKRLLPLSVQGRAGVQLMVADPSPIFYSNNHDTDHSVAGLRLLYVGRFECWKGIHLSLKALALLKSRNVSVRLTAVGGGADAKWLKRLSDNLGLQDYIDWVPWMPKDELPEVYRSHDALLFPSMHDTSPNAVVEGFACGLPAIVLGLGGPKEMVNSQCGHVVDVLGKTQADVVIEIAEVIRGLAEDREALQKLRVGAVQRSVDLTWERSVDRIYNIIGDTLDTDK